MIREPYLAGSWYPGKPGELRENIKKMTDKDALKLDAIGVVSPHAGYAYSGPVAGAVFSRIKFKNTFILLGPNHRHDGKPFSIMTDGIWKTPLGDVRIDDELASAILKASKNLAKDDEIHEGENSLEVQVPFIQYFKSDAMIVPILLWHANPSIYKEIGRAIANVLKSTSTDAVIVASGDMTHHKPHEKAKADDMRAIQTILDLNIDEFIANSNSSMCAPASVICMLTAAKELGASKAELVKYQTSGDTSGDYSSVVGYAGIIISK